MDSLEKYGIYELRNIAREKGVYSPTTLKKKDLIKEIHLIEKGIKKPCTKQNRGRPVGVMRDFEKNPCENCNYNEKYNEILKNIVEYIKKFIT